VAAASVMKGCSEMSRRVLILGGTRFFGKKLVQYLIKNDDDVSIATRGKTNDDFGDSIRRFIIDRKSETDLMSLVNNGNWDIIYDNICYTPYDAQIAVRAFAGKARRYIFISTLSTYSADGAVKLESDFDPYHYRFDFGDYENFSYADGKRAAEAVFYQQANFPITAVRFPIVLGTDDYTKRLHFHVERVKNGQEIGVDNLDAKMCFITSDEAAELLFWIGNVALDGPVNACSTNQLKIAEIFDIFEDIFGKKPIVTKSITDENRSPFNVTDSWYMDTSKARHAGFKFKNLHDWFPKLVAELAKEGK